LFDELDLETVPILFEEYILGNDIDKLVTEATIKSTIAQIPAEGIVIRLREEKIDMLLSVENFNNGRVTFKVINPEFLIKFGE
jgi:hypothetical protein